MPKRSSQYLAWQLAIAACFLVASLAGLPAPIVSDEVFSLETARLPYPQFIGALRADVHPPLYYFLLKPWFLLYPANPVFLRLFSTLFLLLALWRFQRLLVHRGLDAFEAWSGSAILLANPLLLLMAGYGRMYTLELLLCVLTLEASSHWLDRGPSAARFLALAACVAGGVLTHNWFAFFLLGLGVWTLLEWRSSAFRLAAPTIAGLALAVVVWGGPLLSQVTSRGEHLAWLKRPGPGALLDVAIAHGVLLALCSPALLLLAARHRKPGDASGHAPSPWPAARPAFAALAVVVAVPFVISQFKPVLNPRFTVVAAPFLALALIPFLPRFGRKGALALAAGAAIWAPVSAYTGTACNSRQAAIVLAREAQPGDTVLFARLSRKPVEWYSPGDDLTRRSFPAEIDSHPGYEGDWTTPARLDQLRAEAAHLAAELRSRPNSRVFVLADPSREPSRILLDRLQSDFGPPESVCLQCDSPDRHYFNRLVAFRVKP